MPKFEPRQLQAFDSAQESTQDYYKRGGVAHKATRSETAVCGSLEPHVAVTKWRMVNCLKCFSVRAKFRASLKKRGQVVK